jgi:hypothetical protein
MKKAAMNQQLTTDEYDALEQIRRGARTDRASACVGRNAKRLAGLKLIQYGRDGRVAMTDKGNEVLFVRRCLSGLRALAADPQAALDADVVQFLTRKSHIGAQPEGGFALTAKGRESLDDIDGQAAR